MSKLILRGLIASLTAAILANVFSTWFVQHGLLTLGIDMPISIRVGMIVDDLAMLPNLLGLFIVCFAIAFSITQALFSKFAGNRHIWFIVAGASAWLTTILIMQALLNVMPIAGARSNTGFVFQILAGAMGGWLFAVLSQPVQETKS